MDHNHLQSITDFAAPISVNLDSHLNDNGSSITRAGLRQTDLSTQLDLNNKKKHRLKTQSILYNGKNGSKSSLLDQGSVNSNQQQYQHQHQQQHHYQQQFQHHGAQLQFSNQQYYAPPSVKSSYYEESISSGSMNYPYNQSAPYRNFQSNEQLYHSQQHHGYNNQHAVNYATNTHYGSQENNTSDYLEQQQQQQQPPPPPSPQQQQTLNYAKKRQVRESYMYLEEMNGNQSFNSLQSPVLQKRFSSQTGIVGSPMSTPPDETSKRLSFSSALGLPANSNSNYEQLDGTTNTLKFMNTVDGDEEEEDDDEWIDTDGSDQLTHIKRQNNELHLKLKQLQNKIDFSKEEALEKQIQNLNSENKTQTENLARLNDLLKNEKSQNEEILTFTNELIKLLPQNLINDNLIDLIADGNLSNESKKHYKKLLNLNKPVAKSTTPQLSKFSGELSDKDILQILKNDVKMLSDAVIKLREEKKSLETHFNLKIQEERKTIRITATRKILNNEFNASTSGNKKKIMLKKGFKLIHPVLIKDSADLKDTPILQRPDRFSSSSESNEEWEDSLEHNNEIIHPKEFVQPPIITVHSKKPSTIENGPLESPKSLTFETFDA